MGIIDTLWPHLPDLTSITGFLFYGLMAYLITTVMVKITTWFIQDQLNIEKRMGEQIKKNRENKEEKERKRNDRQKRKKEEMETQQEGEEKENSKR